MDVAMQDRLTSDLPDVDTDIKSINTAILFLRSIVQFAKSRMAGARIVPGVRTLGGNGVQALVDLYFKFGFQFFEKKSQCSAHDAGAYQHHVGM